MKKSISLLCAVVLVLSVLAGCAAKTPAPATSSTTTAAAATAPAATAKPADTKPAAAGEYTVNFYAWTAEPNMVPLLDEFNKEFKGKYKLVYKKLANAETMTINTALASGEQIDVMTQAAAFDLRQRVDAGTYLPIDEFLQKGGYTYEGLFGKGDAATSKINGKYYSMPYCRNIQMVYFNKKMFDKAGVAYPKDDWTWDDFRATAKKLTSGEGANKVYGVSADYEKEYWRESAMQKLGAFYYYNKDQTATRFDDPAMKESLQYWYDLVMVDKSAVPLSEFKTLKYDSDTNNMIAMYNGKVAMVIVPVYGALYLNESYGKVPAGTDIGFANMPKPVGASKNVTTFYTSTMSIPSNVKNKEAAWNLMKYIGIDRADLFAGPKAMHPGYDFKTKEDADKFNKTIFTKPGLDLNMSLKVMAGDRDLVSEDNTIVQGQAEINNLIKAVIPKVFNGEMTVDAALKELKTKGDEAVAKGLKK